MKKRLVPAVMVIMLLIGVIHTVFTEGSPMEEIIIQSPNGNVFGVLRLPEAWTWTARLISTKPALPPSAWISAAAGLTPGAAEPCWTCPC